MQTKASKSKSKPTKTEVKNAYEAFSNAVCRRSPLEVEQKALKRLQRIAIKLGVPKHTGIWFDDHSRYVEVWFSVDSDYLGMPSQTPRMWSTVMDVDRNRWAAKREVLAEYYFTKSMAHFGCKGA